MLKQGSRRVGATPRCGDVLVLSDPVFVRPDESSRSIYNYRADAGAGSNTITVMSDSPGWRAALLGTVAAGALWLGMPRYARAQVVPPSAPCDDVSGTNVICTGNVSAGIKVTDPYTVLNVHDLTTNIAPASGVDGIYFHNTPSLTINSDTTPFAILVTGVSADGIDAVSQGAVIITHTGDIDAGAGRYGIYAVAVGTALSVTSTGEVIGGQRGIEALNFGTGALTVTANGDVVGGNTGSMHRTMAPVALLASLARAFLVE